MANVFANLPLPALNGAGAAVDVSTQGVPKTVEVVGSFRGTSIAVEGSTDGGVTFAPICVFQDVGGKKVLDVVCDHMRVNIRGRKAVVPFSANCDVGAPEDVPVFASIAIPASNGAGAATDISAFGDTITIVCGGTFRGAVVAFEISEDGVDYAPLFSFAGQGGIKSAIVTASFVRARVSGRRSSAPFSATASIGAATTPLTINTILVDDEGVPVGQFTTLDFTGAGVLVVDGGGGVATIAVPGTVVVDDEGGSLGTFRTLNFTGPGVTASDAGGNAAAITINGAVGYVPEIWAQNDVAAGQAAVALSAQLSTIADQFKAIRPGSIVGLGTQLTEAVTAGTLTVEVYVNGVATGLLLAHTSASNASGGQVSQAAGVDTYVAGDLIDVRLTTTAGFTPITTDLECRVQVLETP